jgi:hypothetical protein
LNKENPPPASKGLGDLTEVEDIRYIFNTVLTFECRLYKSRQVDDVPEAACGYAILNFED